MEALSNKDYQCQTPKSPIFPLEEIKGIHSHVGSGRTFTASVRTQKAPGISGTIPTQPTAKRKTLAGRLRVVSPPAQEWRPFTEASRRKIFLENLAGTGRTT